MIFSFFEKIIFDVVFAAPKKLKSRNPHNLPSTNLFLVKFVLFERYTKLSNLHQVPETLDHFWSLPSASKTHFGLVGPLGVKIYNFLQSNQYKVIFTSLFPRQGCDSITPEDCFVRPL